MNIESNMTGCANPMNIVAESQDDYISPLLSLPDRILMQQSGSTGGTQLAVLNTGECDYNLL